MINPLIQHSIPITRGVHSGQQVLLQTRLTQRQDHLVVIIKLVNPPSMETVRKLRVTYYSFVDWNITDATIDALEITHRYAEELQDSV